ncbi:MAG TPA: TetR/AcrR family transcriptional regulator [Myxococcota bacterium]|nr:TetR/AcrR family transcriptional regulator [Myxococcota bacterium]
MPTKTRSRKRTPVAELRRLSPRRLPLQERARKRVDRILDVTVALLAKQGLDALSTAGIAERAGIPIGSVYQYFPSKEAILVEVAARKFQAVDTAFAAGFSRDLERMPWRRALERALDASVTAFRSDPAYVAVWRAARSSEAFRSLASAYDARFAAALESVPLIARIPAARRRIAARTAIRVANTLLDAALESEDPREAAAIVREMKRVLVSYLAEDLDSLETGRSARALASRAGRGG